MAQFKGVRKLSVKQYNKLKSNGLLDKNILYVTPEKGLSVLQGETAPTTETEGVVGQLYLDIVEKKLYQCVSVTETTYEWQAVGSGVSQEDFDKLVNNEIQIKNKYNGFAAGNGSITLNGIAIGDGASAKSGNSDHPSIAIGKGSQASGSNSIALGKNAKIKSSIANNNIQLGEGTNSQANTLQVFNDNIYNHETHTLTVQNMNRYTHNLVYNFDTTYVLVSVLNKTATAMTRADLYSLLVERGHISLTTMLSAGGVHTNAGVIGIYANTENTCLTVFTTTGALYDLDMTDDWSTLTFTDTVIQL